jgi:hypothetical protein
MTFAVNLAQSASNNVTMRNRIINGAMTVAQRGSTNVTQGGSVTYIACDRLGLTNYWGTGQVNTAQSTTAPAGFSNSVSLTVATAAPMNGSTGYAAPLWQAIEGYNIADCFNSSVTLSFWVRSSVTGTYSVTFSNVSNLSIGDGSRMYVANYTINAADTWEQKTITVNLATGTASGTWNTTNGSGLSVAWNLGAESNRKGDAALNNWITVSGSYPVQSAAQTNWISNSGATFYITGVQLEKGTAASPFENRLYGTELALCQRYYVDLANNGGSTQNAYRAIGFGSTYNTTAGTYVTQVPVPMRALPSLTQAGTMYLQNLGSTSVSSFAGPYSIAGTVIEGDFNMVGAVAANAPGILRWNNSATQKFAYSAEL